MERTRLLFDAILRPHRSLGPRGFLALMIFVALVSFAAGIAFVSIGAWPVFGFFGLDALALYVAFRLMTLRNALRGPGALRLASEGWAANAELIGRAARHARRIETVPVIERHDLRPRESRIEPWIQARQVWQAGSRIRLGPARAAEEIAS